MSNKIVKFLDWFIPTITFVTFITAIALWRLYGD